MAEKREHLTAIPLDEYLRLLNDRLNPKQLTLGIFAVLMTAVKDPRKPHEAYSYHVQFVKPCKKVEDRPGWFSVGVQHVDDKDFQPIGEPCWIVANATGEIDVMYELINQDPSLVGAYFSAYDANDEDPCLNSATGLTAQNSLLLDA